MRYPKTIKRLFQIRDLIAKNQERFLYRNFFALDSETDEDGNLLHLRSPANAETLLRHDCGSVGCVIGWCCAVGIAEGVLTTESSYQNEKTFGRSPDAVARDWLGISAVEGYALFYCGSIDNDIPSGNYITDGPEQALLRLDYLIKRYINHAESQSNYTPEDIKEFIQAYEINHEFIEYTQGRCFEILEAYRQGQKAGEGEIPKVPALLPRIKGKTLQIPELQEGIGNTVFDSIQLTDEQEIEDEEYAPGLQDILDEEEIFVNATTYEGQDEIEKNHHIYHILKELGERYFTIYEKVYEELCDEQDRDEDESSE